MKSIKSLKDLVLRQNYTINYNGSRSVFNLYSIDGNTFTFMNETKVYVFIGSIKSLNPEPVKALSLNELLSCWTKG